MLLPLRAFLGLTFVYAGLQKLANPNFFDAASPISVAGQIRSLQHTSPLGGLLGLAAHTPTLAGLAIAVGELAVGLGALLGLYTRVAAVGGILLSLTFFLTVSWTTTPYYYGADIVFVFAWLTLFGMGDRGVLSLQTCVSDRARQRVRRNPRLATAHPGRVRAAADRRATLETRRAAVFTAGGAVALAGLAAVAGRVAGGTRSAAALTLAGQAAPSAAPVTSTSATDTAPTTAPATHTAALTIRTTPGTSTADPTTRAAAGATTSADHAAAAPSAAPSTARSAAPSTHAAAPARLPGKAIGRTADVPVGQARAFTDPASGDPAWLVQPSAGHFVAFDAVCTHAGCTVDYNPSTVHFDCPCHGGMFNARTGRVLQGPPPSPLRAIPVAAINGQLRVDV